MEYYLAIKTRLLRRTFIGQKDVHVVEREGETSELKVLVCKNIDEV